MSEQMPTLFIGHGSPMNAIEENEFTQGWREMTNTIPVPKAIVSVSAHWFVPYTLVTNMEQPRTIHDFYGFPPKLYQQKYPAPGNPKLAAEISSTLSEYSIGLDTIWGLDHGTWSVLKKMYPEAGIPTIQLSIDYSKSLKDHFELGQKLEFLREQDVLIIGSGNLVHNLSAVVWNQPSSIYKWAQNFEDTITESLFTNDESVLLNFDGIEDIAQRSHPSLDHYIPLLYAVGAGSLTDKPAIYNQKIIHGSISMTCFKFG